MACSDEMHANSAIHALYHLSVVCRMRTKQDQGKPYGWCYGPCTSLVWVGKRGVGRRGCAEPRHIGPLPYVHASSRPGAPLPLPLPLAACALEPSEPLELHSTGLACENPMAAMRNRTSPYAYAYTYAYAHPHAHTDADTGTSDSSSAPCGDPYPRGPAASAPPAHRYRQRTPSSWPPWPSVEDDPGGEDGEGEPPAHTRGTMDQEALMEELALPLRERTSMPYAYTRPPMASMPSTSQSTAERQPMPYRFVKSDLNTEQHSMWRHDIQTKPEPTTRDSDKAAQSSGHHPTDSHRSRASPTTSCPVTCPMSPPRFSDRPRSSSRYDRAETTPSSFPQSSTAFSPPYPVDDRAADVYMPPEEQYQFDHSTVELPLPRQSPSPVISSPSLVGSSCPSDVGPSLGRRTTTMSREPSFTRTIEQDTARACPDTVDWRDQRRRNTATQDLEKPLPSCPRSAPSRNHDWYRLRGYDSFDICPACYHSVFEDTPFAGVFSQTRVYTQPVERVCSFSNPWIRLAWLLTIQKHVQSFELLYALASIAETELPCPGDNEVGTDHMDWYGISDLRSGWPVANFAVCPCDKKMLEALFPTMRRFFTRLSSSHPYSQDRYICSLRTSSRRSRKYLDLIVELDAEAQSLHQQFDIASFLRLIRDNTYKGECNQDRTYLHKAWYFIPSLPEFTVCEECYADCVWPAMQSRVSQSTIPRMFNKAIQLVPGEDPELGSSCCLYSAHMRRVWDTSIREENFAFLAQRALERKRVETRLLRERKGIMHWMKRLERGTSQWARAKLELRNLDQEWAAWQ